MNKYLSNKLKIISLTGMIIVVYGHSYNLTVNFKSGGIKFSNQFNLFIQNFFLDHILAIALALFFCMSGYLFFFNFTGSFDEIALKYQKRVRSLLLPYLIWSLWGISVYIILQSIPESSNFFTRDVFLNYRPSKIFETIFIHPIPYQLWFLRDLIMMVICSPLIYILLKKAGIIPVLVLFLNWLGLIDINFMIFADNSILFFSAGAYLAIYNTDLPAKRPTRSYSLLFTSLWITLIVAETVLLKQGYGHLLIPSLLKKAANLTGILVIWSTYDLVKKQNITLKHKLLNLSSYSFFVYMSHEPLLTVIKKGLFYLTGFSELISFFIFLIAPILTILICVNSAKLLHSFSPKFYHLISGGR